MAVPRSAYSACVGLIDAGDNDRALRALTREGVSADVAEEFVASFVARLVEATAVVVHISNDGYFSGGTVGWIDAGDHGLWLTPAQVPTSTIDGTQDDGDEDTQEIETTTAEQIAGILLSFLPSAENV